MLLKRLPKALVADTVADPEGKNKKKKKKKALRDDVRVWSFPQSFDAKCISTGCWRSSVALVLFVLTCFLLPPVCFSGSEGKCIRVRVNAKGKKGGNHSVVRNPRYLTEHQREESDIALWGALHKHIDEEKHDHMWSHLQRGQVLEL